MANLKEYVIDFVSSIQITSAMKMVSAAKLKRMRSLRKNAIAELTNLQELLWDVRRVQHNVSKKSISCCDHFGSRFVWCIFRCDQALKTVLVL
jgi:hypothetical protein